MSTLAHLFCFVISYSFVADTHSVEVVQPCTGSTIALSCPQDTRIQIQQVLLADSSCFKALSGRCCPASSDCTVQPSEGHRRTVESRCNGQRFCSADVEQKKFDCSGSWINNDYERVTYECLDGISDETRRHTSAQDAMTTSTSAPATVANVLHQKEAALISSDVMLVATIVIAVFILLVVMNVCLWIRLKGRRRTISAASSSVEPADMDIITIGQLVRPAVVGACSGPMCVLDHITPTTNNGDECGGQHPALPAVRQIICIDNHYDKLDEIGKKCQMMSAADQEDVYWEPSDADGLKEKAIWMQDDDYENTDGYLIPFVVSASR